MAEGKNRYDQATLYKLQKWLEILCEDTEDCPIISADEHDIELLLSIKAKNEMSEEHMKEVIKTNRNLIQFYDSKTKKMEDLIDSEMVSISKETKRKTESLAKLASEMSLAEPNQTNFLYALCDLKNRNCEDEGQKIRDCFKLSSLSRKIVDCEEKNEVINREVKILEKIVSTQDVRKMKVLEHKQVIPRKAREYKNAIKQSQKFLHKAGFIPQLSHGQLVEKNKSLIALNEELEEAKKKLDYYVQLPPNEELAQREVNRKDLELKKIEMDISKLLSALEKEVRETAPQNNVTNCL